MKKDLTIKTIFASFKIASMFIAPGTGTVLGLIAKGIGYANALTDMYLKIKDAET